MNIKSTNTRLELCPPANTGATTRRLGRLAAGVLADEATTYAQVFTNDGQTFSGDNTYSGANTFSGNNTHTGTETFSNAAGVTTDTITPRTSGGGTSYLRPAGRLTTTPIAAAALKSGGVYTLAKADGIAITLPALATATIGTTFKFHVETTSTSGGYVISTGEAGDVFFGSLWATIANPDAANDMELNVAATTVNTLTLGATTACGLAGGWFEVTAVSATQWAISGIVLGSGTVASNLFSTV